MTDHEKENMKPASLRLPADVLDAIYAEAARLDLPPATFLRNVVLVGWDNYGVLRRFGIVWTARAWRRLSSSLVDIMLGRKVSR